MRVFENAFFLCMLTTRPLAQLISRVHIFPLKILPNSVDQFAKFHGLPWQNHPNSTAHLGLLFVSKLSSVLFKYFSY